MMDGEAEIELRKNGGSVAIIYDGRADILAGRHECEMLCRRIEDYWHSRGCKSVKCRPVAKEYRGRRLTGEKFVARYWEVSSNIGSAVPA
jgi:hypothetical protein